MLCLPLATFAYFRLDFLAVLPACLTLAAWRRQRSGIGGIVTPHEPDGIESVYHLYVIRIEGHIRSDLQSFLAEREVQTGIHYPAPIHRTTAFARFSAQSCPVAERYSSQILSLPMYPELEREQLEYVASMLGNFAGQPDIEMMVRN